MNDVYARENSNCVLIVDSVLFKVDDQDRSNSVSLLSFELEFLVVSFVVKERLNDERSYAHNNRQSV